MYAIIRDLIAKIILSENAMAGDFVGVACDHGPLKLSGNVAGN